MKFIIKSVAAFVIVGLASPALADITEHDTLPACYASISLQCDQGGGCSEEDYNWGFDQCDEIYGNAAEIKPQRPIGLTVKTSNKRFRANVLKSMK